MTKQLKTWTTLGLAALGSAAIAHGAAREVPSSTISPGALILAQAEADGEGGGEGGGSTPQTYALESTQSNAYSYDARPQIEAYADLVHSAYVKAAEDAQNRSRRRAGPGSRRARPTFEPRLSVSMMDRSRKSRAT
jgi:hypothetical protein